jgi:myo-inositol-1(or 4)-monophosphatase
VCDAAELSDLRSLAVRVGTAAAGLLVEGRGRADLAVATKSTSTDLVTELDAESEQLVVAALLEARPDDGILGEEGTSVAGSSGVTWVIDPLDGTTNYVYGHPGYSVSIAAVVDEVPVVGVVVDPVLGDVFSAHVGGGAQRGDAPIRCSTRDDLALALVATGFSYSATTRRHQASVLERLIGEVRDVRRMGGAALDLCSTACGRVDAYYELGLQPWDRAAGTVIAREAGAVVSGLDSDEPDDGFLIAASPGLHGALRRLLLDAGAVSGRGASPRRAPG